MVIRMKDGQVYALDYRETAPARATHDMYLDSSGKPTDRSLYGHLASGVPGSVAGLLEAHRRFGRLPLARVIDPAIRLASEGFVVDSARSRSIAAHARQFQRHSPASVSQFLVDGNAPAPGTMLRQPDLGRTLEAIRDHGRDGF